MPALPLLLVLVGFARCPSLSAPAVPLALAGTLPVPRVASAPSLCPARAAPQVGQYLNKRLQMS